MTRHRTARIAARAHSPWQARPGAKTAPRPLAITARRHLARQMEHTVLLLTTV
jgi:hypothetical protein